MKTDHARWADAKLRALLRSVAKRIADETAQMVRLESDIRGRP
jgi:hypothetical protein